jgi:D-alanyl-D-alanine-carboxypeptidase/D-alanyl-D-alanine-endopeptidase
MSLHASLTLGLLSLLLPASVFAGAAPNPSSSDGIWLGTLSVGAQSLRIQIQMHAGASAQCVLDSVDQKAFGMACSSVQKADGTLSITVPAVNGVWSGQLAADGKTLTGTWTQGGPSLELVLARQTAAIEPPKEAANAAASAMPPVALTDLKAVLDRDLVQVLKDGALAPETHGGVAIGVVQHGERHIFSYGAAKPDSVFEIGSITKTFTGLILAQMVEQGKVRLDEPVRELLPPDTVAKPATGAEISLLDLSDQHSGLPRMPDNFKPADPENPYADYDAKLLYAFISKQGVTLPASAPFGYSNLGVGLLGQALANRAAVPYPTLLQAQVTGPLGMHDTAIVLTPELKARMIEGHDAEHKAAHVWDLDALAGAGGIRSTAADMLTYLEAQLHPDKLPAAVLGQANGKTLPVAIAKSHEIHAEVGNGMHIALNWFRIDATGSYWHNGGTGGYSAYAQFNPGKDFAVIVLSNTGPDADSFTDKLGQHIAQRLSGLPAVALYREMPKAVAIDPKLLDGYVGVYELTPTFALTFTREGDRLFTQATGQEKAEVFPESEKTFFLKVVDAKVTFVTDASGRATSVILHQGGRDQEAKRKP